MIFFCRTQTVTWFGREMQYVSLSVRIQLFLSDVSLQIKQIPHTTLYFLPVSHILHNKLVCAKHLVFRFNIRHS